MKKLSNLLLLIVGLLGFSLSVNAASGSITASASNKTVVVGSTFTVTVKVSCSEALGSWQYGISYDSSYISLQSGDTSVASYGDGSTKSKTYTYKFKAIKSGSAGIRITGASMVSWNDVDTLFTPSITNASVTVKTQAEIEASYSKDNNLKSLSVEGFEIIPSFSKDVTEYSVEVPDDILSINVQAKVNDANASVRGTGNIDVSEGSNRIEVVVTAQNGATKTYIINVTVKDLNPIETTINGSKYSIVKKESLLTCPIGYTPSVIKIGEIDVPAFVSDLTKFTLVGLKDENGNVALYIYNDTTNEYTLYTEIKSSILTLYSMNFKEIPKGFKETKVVINENEYNALYSKYDKDYILIYAMNVETGNTDYYIYDKTENSYIKYNDKVYNALLENKKECNIYLIALSTISLILLILSITLGIKNSKIKKILLKENENHKQVKKENNNDKNLLE